MKIMIRQTLHYCLSLPATVEPNRSPWTSAPILAGGGVEKFKSTVFDKLENA